MEEETERVEEVAGEGDRVDEAGMEEEEVGMRREFEGLGVDLFELDRGVGEVQIGEERVGMGMGGSAISGARRRRWRC